MQTMFTLGLAKIMIKWMMKLFFFFLVCVCGEKMNDEIVVQRRLRLFWLKMKFGNHFSENNVFGWYGKFGQTENVFSLTEN